MSVLVQLDIPPSIMIDGEHLELPFDMGSRCVNHPSDGLTAFLDFALHDDGCKCNINLGGRNAAGDWIGADTVRCQSPEVMGREQFESLLGDFTLKGNSAVRLAFGEAGAVQEVRDAVIDHFHESIGKYDLKVKCQWHGNGLRISVHVDKFGLNKATFVFHMPYEAACRVLQDRRRKSA